MEKNSEKVNQGAAPGPLLEEDHGYYAAATLINEVQEVFEFCQREEYVKRVLTDLPQDVENFLDLRLVSGEQTGPDQYKVVWENADPKTKGRLTFLFKKGSFERRTIITSEAKFENLNFNEDGPSTLMNLFLKRMKALIETGEIPTIKGQPSGREEIKQLH